MSIERLRALEKDIRNSGGPGCQYHADQLASIIAELGQEVGEEQAPAWFYVRTPGADYDYTFTKTREEAIDLQDCDEPDEPIPLYTSPAHTSEARDAARLDWLDANGFTAYRAIDPIDGLSGHCVVVHETQRPRRGNVHDTIRGAIDAAMGEAK